MDPARQMARLARHRRNYDLIEEQACLIPRDQWIALKVKLRGSTIEIVVDEKSVLNHDDGEKSPAGGLIGFRSWHSRVSFRNLSVQTTGEPELLPLKHSEIPFEISGMWRGGQPGFGLSSVFT